MSVASVKNIVKSEALSQIAYYANVLKAPTIIETASRLAETAVAERWAPEEYLAAVLSQEATTRQGAATTARITSARFRAIKTLEEFNLSHQKSMTASMMHSLGGLNFLPETGNVVFLGPPGKGKTHLATGIGIRAAQAGHKVLFGAATEWVDRLKTAHNNGRLGRELARLRKIPVIVIDEIGYLPFDQDAANLFFQLVSDRYEKASIILTSNLPFSQWGEVFGEKITAGAMTDRIVHHAEVINLTGSSYRLRDKKKAILPSTTLLEHTE